MFVLFHNRFDPRQRIVVHDSLVCQSQTAVDDINQSQFLVVGAEIQLYFITHTQREREMEHHEQDTHPLLIR
jgi:hypothetical protein